MIDLKSAPIFKFPWTSVGKTNPRCMKPGGCRAIVREARKCEALQRVRDKSLWIDEDGTFTKEAFDSLPTHQPTIEE